MVYVWGILSILKLKELLFNRLCLPILGVGISATAEEEFCAIANSLFLNGCIEWMYME